MNEHEQRLDRAAAALLGGAIGDAMGMPASFFTRGQIKKTYGYIRDFLTPAGEQSAHGALAAGEVTDDTQESVLLAEQLIEHGRFSREAFLAGMRDWAVKADMLASTVIGPSTRRFLEAVVDGRDPEPGAKLSLTNGSAMRAAPVGIKFWYDQTLCAREAAASSLPSHGSAPCVAAACAVACGVAAGVHGGYSPAEVLELAARGAAYGESVGHELPSPSVEKRILLAREIVDRHAPEGLEAVLDELCALLGAGMNAAESVPFSLGVFYAAGGHAGEGILAAVNAGDDADTNGSIAGNLCGAYSGTAALPEAWCRRVESVSRLDCRALAARLLA